MATLWRFESSSRHQFRNPELADGHDPAHARREDKQAAQMSAANTFEIVAREWVEQQRNRWTPGHAGRVLDSLVADAFPEIGFRSIA